MQILFPKINNTGFKHITVECQYPNLMPLQYDSVSFGALKKSKFQGINLAAIEKFKVPIEKFNEIDDLQKWSEKQVEKIVKTDFGGLRQETKIRRKSMLTDWVEYVTKENKNYTPVMQLLILSAVTMGLKPDEDKLPPLLNKNVLDDVIENLKNELEENPRQQFNLNKIYRTKLAAAFLETLDTGLNLTGWVIIPSKTRDPENFENNVEKLETLSHKNWCTKSLYAETYLYKGDFHMYLENGKPKIGIRILDNYIAAIEGELNNGKIPIEYYDEIKNHLADTHFKILFDVEEELEKAKKLKAKTDKVKAELKDAIKTNDAKTIFNYFKINCEELSDGMLKISEYRQPDYEYTYKDIGIDENRLFEKVKEIESDANFSNSQLTALRNLESIGRIANFANSKLTDLGKLKIIGDDAEFEKSQLCDLGNLESIGGNAYFPKSKVTSIGKLKSIGKSAYIYNSKLKNEDFTNIDISRLLIS